MRFALVLLGGALVASPVQSQRRNAPAAAAPAIDTAAYAQLHFRHIGPEGNRVSAVAGVIGDPATYYAGAASGGIWKTTDGGIHWEPVFDDQPVSSIGALAVAPSDPNVVWAGTGEPFIRSQHLDRLGRLQVHRRRQELDEDGARQHRPHLAHRRAPDQPGHRLRRGAGPPVRAAAGARHLPDHRRRQDLGARAVRERQHGRVRSGDGSEQSADPLRRHLADRDPHLGPDERRRGQRHLDVHATAARPGRASPVTGCRRSRSARSASP